MIRKVPKDRFTQRWELPPLAWKPLFDTTFPWLFLRESLLYRYGVVLLCVGGKRYYLHLDVGPVKPSVPFWGCLTPGVF